MTMLPRFFGVMLALSLGPGAAFANDYDETIELFKHAGESAVFFTQSYAFAVFPTIGAGGLIVGGARGVGQVYVRDRVVGDAVMTQLSIGFQAGGKAYSEIIFFQDKRALDEFESGKFEFAAGASAVAITAGASASVGTDRASSGASGGKNNATTNGDYQTGMRCLPSPRAASCFPPIFPARSLLTRRARVISRAARLRHFTFEVDWVFRGCFKKGDDQ